MAPARLIASTRIDSNPKYSPDGKKIVFTSDRSGHLEIWICDNDGANPIALTSFGGGGTGSPRWSPDGRWIAFDHVEEGTDIYVISADGGPPRRLTTEPSDDIRPSWSGDRQWIYFGSNRSGEYQIWKVPVSGRPAVQLNRNGGYEVFESPDGSSLFYAFRDPEGIWSTPTEAGRRPGYWKGGGRFAVNGEGIFVTDPPGTPGAKIQCFRFATRQWSTLWTLPNQSMFVGGNILGVSSDSRRILYEQLDRVESDLMLVENFR